MMTFNVTASTFNSTVSTFNPMNDGSEGDGDHLHPKSLEVSPSPILLHPLPRADDEVDRDADQPERLAKLVLEVALI